MLRAKDLHCNSTDVGLSSHRSVTDSHPVPFSHRLLALQSILATLQQDPVGNWREVASRMLDEGSSLVPSLIRMIEMRDSPARLPAIWALGEIGDPRAVPAIIKALENGDSRCIRVNAALALLKLNDPTGLAKVRQFFGENSGSIKEA